VKVLVIGSGAREHALIRSLKSDPDVTEVIAAPGNAGMALDVPVHSIDVADGEAIGDLAVDLDVDLVVIGPELPLVNGAADAVRARGVACFGPSAEAAQLEGSKAFAKQVMAQAGVPTAMALLCTNAMELASALDRFGAPYVVKDDGLAAGKGVVVTSDRNRALEHGEACFASGGQVIVEEFLDGPEVSLFALTDGSTVIPLQPAQDFKRAHDDDEGPNTGGMGAYAPLPWAPHDLVAEVTQRVLEPTVREMARRGTPFIGLLYAGLALTNRGVRVVEFNARFGDPETQVVLAQLASPLGRTLMAAATGTLANLPPLKWRDGYSVTVVLAAPGYPEQPIVGGVLSGIPEAQAMTDVDVFHAGTRVGDAGEVVASGGRVLSVTAHGRSVAEARERVYAAMDCLSLAGSHYRRDIALRASMADSGRDDGA
jgi:phosphoribosylamine---glycine ligase